MLRALRPRPSWQGPIGVLLVVVAVALLAGAAWAVLAAGVFFLVGAAIESWDARRFGAEDGEPL